jgi:hypothetical protein
MIHGVWSIIRNFLENSDQRRGDACLCMIRVVDSYPAFVPLRTWSLVDTLIEAVNQLLLPAGGSEALGHLRLRNRIS